MSAAPLRIAPVAGRGEHRRFVRLPYRLYRDARNWVAPLLQEEQRRWSPRHNPSLAGRTVSRWLALRGRTVVGRIAAVIDPAFIERWEPAGFFGFFECQNDPEAASALLRAAESFAGTHGLKMVLGPVNLSTHGEVGTLVAGYDSPPTVLSPYNPSYYPELLEGAGCVPARDYHAYRWTPDARPQPVLERFLRLAARNHAAGPQLRPLDRAHWDEDVRAIFEVYNAAFADVWGFVPIGWDEFRAQAAEFRQFYRPELVVIAELAGEAVGFGLLLPDINVALLPLRGRLFPLGFARLLHSVPRIDTGRFILLGVRPQCTGHGVAALISQRLVAAVRQAGYRAVELSLVQEGNDPVRHVIAAFGAPLAKTYRLYRKQVG